jgi:hypothetical protein
MRYYVVADVYGYYTQMKSAIEKAGFFTDSTLHKLIMLGDIFDRGHEAKQVQQFVLEQMEQDGGSEMCKQNAVFTGMPHSIC